MTGTALAAIAAIGGLWAQAVASYWSQQTAKDQLNQSNEDGDREKRDHASKITYWVEAERVATAVGYPVAKIHVLNRSPDPVSIAQLIVRAKGGLWVLHIPYLRPCSDVVYSADQMELAPFSGEPERFNLSDVDWEVQAVYFVDRSGKRWLRKPTALDEWSGTPWAHHIPKWRGTVMTGLEDVKKADPCEGDNS
ncbi:hypothetical protein POD33_21570 [Streptomyces moderatus]|nr:hypothetical protein POD33_21570 [Streptomyces moderatus]